MGSHVYAPVDRQVQQSHGCMHEEASRRASGWSYVAHNTEARERPARVDV
jgi:hypothetical protein